MKTNPCYKGNESDRIDDAEVHDVGEAIGIIESLLYKRRAFTIAASIIINFN